MGSFNNHEFCIIDEVSRLLDRKFTCYLEYEIPIPNSRNRKKLIVDILAIRGREKLVIEVGTLSLGLHRHDRLELLKILMPDARVIHVHQWKNYGITEDVILRAYESWRYQMRVYGNILDPDLNNEWFSGCFNYKQLPEEEYAKCSRKLTEELSERTW